MQPDSKQALAIKLHARAIARAIDRRGLLARAT
jgi:hypothetical protein